MVTRENIPRKIETIVSSLYQWLGATRVRTPFTDGKARGMAPFLTLQHVGPAPLKPGTQPFSNPFPGGESGVVTYLIEGLLEYRDEKGNRSRLSAGDLHWTWGRTAHSGTWTLPQSGKEQEATFQGIQVWTHLPASIHLRAGFKCIRAGQIPKVQQNNAAISVLAGTWHSKRSPLVSSVPLQLLQVTLAPNEAIALPVPAGYHAAAYVVRGFALFGGEGAEAYVGDLVRFGREGQTIAFRSPGTSKTTILLLSGEAAIDSPPQMSA